MVYRENEEERIGFYICHCGINIAFKVRCAEVAEYIATLPHVAVSRDYLFMCSDPGQQLIEEDIAKHGLTRVVVASCSPRMHEKTFSGACSRAGLNPYRAFHMVCVREHVSWVTRDMDEATEKAKVVCRAGVSRVLHQKELFPKSFSVTPATLIVGGGIAGMQAALDVASAGFKVYLVEKSPTVGGHMLQYDKTFPTLDCAACIGTPKMVEVGQHENIELLSYSEVQSVEGFVGNFKVKVLQKARFVDMDKCTGCGECGAVNMNGSADIKERGGEMWVDRLRIDEEACIQCGACVRACLEENGAERHGMSNIVLQRFDAFKAAASDGGSLDGATDLQKLLLMDVAQREEFWAEHFKKCVRCYGCFNVCPTYTPEDPELHPSRWVSRGTGMPEYPAFHLMRAYTVGPACINCGECERMCSAGVPLRMLQQIVIHYTPDQVFDLVPGLSEEAKETIRTRAAGDKRRAAYV
jgi:ferredoxin